ncbi:hypothetical protein B0H11DRAFT_1944709 [Mycena galericulata]|nr:hypothetical protein B0H11DRAFT_1944709 [Mycena galericulata]
MEVEVRTQGQATTGMIEVEGEIRTQGQATTYGEEGGGRWKSVHKDKQRPVYREAFTGYRSGSGCSLGATAGARLGIPATPGKTQERLYGLGLIYVLGLNPNSRFLRLRRFFHLPIRYGSADYSDEIDRLTRRARRLCTVDWAAQGINVHEPGQLGEQDDVQFGVQDDGCARRRLICLTGRRRGSSSPPRRPFAEITSIRSIAFLLPWGSGRHTYDANDGIPKHGEHVNMYGGSPVILRSVVLQALGHLFGMARYPVIATM